MGLRCRAICVARAEVSNGQGRHVSKVRQLRGLVPKTYYSGPARRAAKELVECVSM